MTYLYSAFGLILSSELCCPELLPGDGTPDVHVRFAPDGDRIAEPARPAIGFDAVPGRFELRVPRVGRFVVEHGRTITISRDPIVDDDSLRLFLLGTAIGALLQQRALLPLHGSAVWKDGRSILILGTSGAGKSSLAAALGRHGWRLQSDDISVVTLRNGQAECDAGFPRQKMWPDMLQYFGEDARRFSVIRAGIEKRNVPVEGDAFQSASSVVGAVVALGVRRGKFAAVVPVTGPKRMALLKRLTFRANLRAPLAMHVAHFEIIARLAEQAHVWRLDRPRDGGSPLDLATLLAPHLDTSLASAFDAEVLS